MKYKCTFFDYTDSDRWTDPEVLLLGSLDDIAKRQDTSYFSKYQPSIKYLGVLEICLHHAVNRFEKTNFLKDISGAPIKWDNSGHSLEEIDMANTLLAIFRYEDIKGQHFDNFRNTLYEIGYYPTYGNTPALKAAKKEINSALLRLGGRSVSVFNFKHTPKVIKYRGPHVLDKNGNSIFVK